MKRLKKVAVMLISLTMCLVFTLEASAASVKVTRLGLSKPETDLLAMSIAEGLTYSYVDTETYQKIAGYLTREEYDSMGSELLNGKKVVEGSYLKDSSVMYCIPELTSTKDTTILVTLKVDYGYYNLMYCVELHVNNEGKIYGHNVWVL